MAAIGYIILIAVALYLIYLLIVYVIIPGLAIALGISISIGALAGGGHAIYNYCVAFAKNVKKERA